MEVADLETPKRGKAAATVAEPAKSGKAASGKAGKVIGQLPAPVKEVDSPLVKQIMALLDTPKGKATLQHKPDEKGFRPRNGRMDIIRAVVEKMGVDASTADLFAKVNEVSVARGLKPIQKTAFYTLVSEVRKQSV
ncbi:hypothetical protein D3C81_1865750 [compost metagenome]